MDLTDRRVRTLTATNLAFCLGTGLWTPLGPLWATRALHLALGRVGLVYTLAGAVSLLIAVPAGRAADRTGAAPVYTAGLAVQAAAMGAASVARDQTGFAAATFLLTAAGQATQGGRAALVAQLAPGRSTDLAAWLRRGANLGAALGFAAAAPVLAAHNASAYRAAAGSFAISYLLAPPDGHGAYQGVFALGRGAVKAAAPALLTGTALTPGAGGWLTLAALFLLGALPARAVVLRAAPVGTTT